jgi:hypothetical protein
VTRTPERVLHDTPAGYRPPRGPAVPMTLSYHHRNVTQPQSFTSANVGPKWTLGWLREEPQAIAIGAHTWVYQPPGGREVYTNRDANGAYLRTGRAARCWCA